MEKEIKDFIYRTVIVKPRQTKELSLKARKIANFQTYFFNMGVEAGLVEKYDKIKTSRTITTIHHTMPWSNKYHTNVATTAFQQEAVNDLLDCQKKTLVQKRNLGI